MRWVIKAKNELRNLVRQRLRSAGFRGVKHLKPGLGKDAYRNVHALARQHEIERRIPKIRRKWTQFKGAFANAEDIDPDQIQPELRIIRTGDTKRNDLFWLARLGWSLPYSQGYGRRIRALVWDRHADRLMGIVGLQSPPLDFSMRDSLFEYPDGQKTYLVNQTMDAYTVGAVPPYNFLLAGKMAAMVLGSNQIRNEYRRRYRDVETKIEGRHIPANLVALTTTSAFGRSSIYARVRDHQQQLMLKSLGMIEQSHGSYQFNGVYSMLREYLKELGIQDKFTGYGTGPRVRWQVIRRGLRALDLPEELIIHRVPREVFIVANIKNLEDYMAGDHIRPFWYDRPFQKLASGWKSRYLKPRWERLNQKASMGHVLKSFREWKREEMLNQIQGGLKITTT